MTEFNHDAILETRQRAWRDEAACADDARWIAQQDMVRNAFITLEGPLGAGKTTFVRHLLRALGVEGRIKSPTYAVLEPYELADGLVVSHFDFYRFADPREFVEAGLRDRFEEPGLKIAEWPDRAGELLPRADLRVVIDVGDVGDGGDGGDGADVGEVGNAADVADASAASAVSAVSHDRVSPHEAAVGEPPRRVRFEALSATGRALLP